MTIYRICKYLCWAMSCFALLVIDAGKVDAGNFVVLRFDGMKTLPHETQVVQGKIEWEPGASTDARVRCILACDVESHEVYCFMLESLWRIDTAAIDEEREFVHVWSGADVLSYSSNSWRLGRPADLWPMGVRTVFADVFDLPIEGSREELVRAVQRQVSSKVFTGSNRWTQGSRWIHYRSIANGGSQVVVNSLLKGEVISAVRANRSQVVESQMQCKSIIFRGNKPWEVREGRIRGSITEELPAEIRKLLVSEGTTLEEKWMLAKDANIVDDFVPSRPSDLVIKRLEWQRVLLAFCVIGFVSSVAIRSFVVSTRRVCHEEG